jgi:hypothetical protein
MTECVFSKNAVLNLAGTTTWTGTGNLRLGGHARRRESERSVDIKALLPIRLTQHGAICCGGPAEENRDASSRLPEDPWRVPSALFYGRRVPAIPQGVALAGRVSVSSVSTCGGVFRGAVTEIW